MYEPPPNLFDGTGTECPHVFAIVFFHPGERIFSEVRSMSMRIERAAAYIPADNPTPSINNSAPENMFAKVNSGDDKAPAWGNHSQGLRSLPSELPKHLTDYEENLRKAVCAGEAITKWPVWCPERKEWTTGETSASGA